MQILIRTDASQQIGSGHVMRCLTLANELRQKACVSFICRELPGNMCDYIKQQGYPVYTNAILAAENCVIDWLIVDHYSLDAQWETTMRPYVRKIMVIDDMANRKHDCDLLLDQNLYVDMETRYHDLVPQHCKQLLGPKYALLRAEFLSARQTLRKRNGSIKRILIFMGGSDPTNETTKALDAIKLLNRPDIAVDVVVGASNPHQEQIKQLCLSLPNTAYYCQVSNMAELMVKADLAIGAGGSTNWERCCLGLPSLVIIIAENQEELTQTLHEQAYLISLGTKEKVSAETILHKLCDILNDPELMLSFIEKGKQLVDGNGAKRVSSMIEDTQIPKEYKLRKATYEDLLTYYNWANDETVRKNSFSSEPIDLETHKNWFQQKLNNPDSLLYILEKNENPVGQIRFDVEEKIAHISYLIDSNYRGQGLGKLIVQLGIKEFIQDKSRKIYFQAAVKPENSVSHKIFQNIGFEKVVPQQTNKQTKQESNQNNLSVILLLGPHRVQMEKILTYFGDYVIHTEEKIYNNSELLEKVDFIISYGYRHIITENIIEQFKNKIINLHISLLPWNRGSDPNLWSFLENTPKGVTIHYIDKGIDTGDILAQKEVEMKNYDTLKTSYERLSTEIEQLFKIVWPEIREGKLKAIPQPKGGSFHRLRDKKAFEYLLINGWDTPIANLIGKAQ